MNRSKKGKRREYEARKVLELQGYLTDFKPVVRFQSQDLFELFDIVAIKGSRVKWIQVKSNPSHFYTAKKDIKNWLNENNLNLNCEVWLKENYKEWRIDAVTCDY